MTVALSVGISWLSGAGSADESKPLVITLQNHVFQPTEIHFPSHQKAEIVVKNLDPTPEEFESGALNIEKVIAGQSEGRVHIRPTEHGHYTFVGEYHEKTARGVLIAD
jgi:hypothetical protein